MCERLAPWPADHAALDVLTLEIPSCSSPLLIEQRAKSSYVETVYLDDASFEAAYSNAGTTVWNAALILIDYFNALPAGDITWPGKRVLELGCGAGAVGLMLAKRNAEVTLSDRGFILDLARANAARNFPPNGEPVRVVELSWAAPVLDLPLFDFVVCSDVLYEGALLLCTTLELLTERQPSLKIFLAYQSRNENVEQPFWQAMNEKFNCVRRRRLFVKHRREAVIIEERDATKREALNEIAVYEIRRK